MTEIPYIEMAAPVFAIYTAILAYVMWHAGRWSIRRQRRRFLASWELNQPRPDLRREYLRAQRIVPREDRPWDAQSGVRPQHILPLLDTRRTN